MTTTLPKHIDFELAGWAEFEQGDQLWEPSGLLEPSLLLSYALAQGSGVALDGSSNNNHTDSSLNWLTGDATYDPVFRVQGSHAVTHDTTGIVSALSATHTYVFAFRWPTTQSSGTFSIWGFLSSVGAAATNNARINLSAGSAQGSVQFEYRDHAGNRTQGLMNTNRPMRDNQWHEVVVEVAPDSAVVTIWYDAELMGTTYTHQAPWGALSYNGKAGLGGRYQINSLAGDFPGDLAYLHLLDRPLTADERLNTHWKAVGT